MTSIGQAAARALYATLLRLLAPLYLLRLWRRGRREPGYREALGERFGRYRGPRPATGAVWLHAVSLGETRAAAPLVEALREQRPGVRLLLTHGTATGRAAGQSLMREGDSQAWLPYDTPGAARRFLRRFRPAVGVLMETEIWPCLMHEAERAGVPMVLANARLSERSARRGRRLAVLMVPAARRLALALAQSAGDAERIRAAGAPQVLIGGNLKYDMRPPADQLERGRRWRAAVRRPVVLMASSREGEEEALLRAWSSLVAPRPLLLIVPRHPQRFDAVAQMVSAAGLELGRRSVGGAEPPPASTEVWLGDTLGELPFYYACADVALLGGSFEALGGQNLIEAAACGCPLVMGPHTFNFAEASELALRAGAALRVADIAEGVGAAVALAAGPDLAERARRALEFAASHRGAAERMARQILAAAAGEPAS